MGDEDARRPRGRTFTIDELVVPDLHEPLEDLDRCPECGLFEGHKMDCSRSPRSQLRVYATRNPDGSFTADGPVTP